MFIPSFLWAVVALSVITKATSTLAQAPALAGAGAPISSRDRIYTGDQTSNTITVIDPGSNTVLGTITIGNPRLDNALNPQNTGTVNTHGLGFSRDGKHIVSLSTLSNTVKVIRTKDNRVISTAYVDRGPHEAFFAPDNRSVWIGTRGVASVQIIDGLNGTTIGRISTGNGPSKVLFSPDGSTAYVNHIMDPIISVVDVKTQQVRYNITGLADKFCSDMMLSADGYSLWAAHKMTGQVSVIDVNAKRVSSILDVGAEVNHPNFAVINGITHAFVTVGSLNATRVYRQQYPHDQPVWIKDVVQSGIQPHGIWPSADNTKMYVVNEHSDTVDVIDTDSLEVVNTMNVGQEGQALIYVSNAVPQGHPANESLSMQGLGMRVKSVRVPVSGKNTSNEANAQITVRETGTLDMFQVIGRQLVLNGTYTVSARRKTCTTCDRTPLVSFKATVPTNRGCGSATQVLAFFNFFNIYDMTSLWVEEMVTELEE